MKRWILFTILAAVLLSGCTENAAADETVDPMIQATEPAPGLYVPQSVVETQTNGAVRQYALGQDSFLAMDFMESDILLFFEEEAGVSVTRLAGVNCYVAVRETLSAQAIPNGSSVRTEGRVLAYYNAEDNSVVYLNDLLRETSRRKLLHEITGAPALGRDIYSVYYSVGNEVYVSDLQTGIYRLVRQYDTQAPVMKQVVFDDSMILCADTGSVFISSVNGTPMGVDSTLENIATLGSEYMLLRKDGGVDEVLFGSTNAIPTVLTPKEQGTVYPALTMDGAVTAATEGDNLQLAFYDLSSGKRTAAVTVPALSQVLTVQADDLGRYVWIVARDSIGKTTLLRWDIALSKTDDQTEYSHPRYSLENPDQEGIAQCQTVADDISKRHGVNIYLLADVKQPEGYTLNYEYQVKAIQQGLEQLDAVLSKFPEGFIAALKSISGDKGIHIGLIRSAVDSAGNVTEPEGLQYWLDGEAYIAVSLGQDVQKAALHQISHVLDTYIFTNSVLYDEWNEVNPVDFHYDENYTDYLNRTESPYLRESGRCFIDAYSMTFAKEDRARILEYAMTEGNEAYFASPVMQNKLLRVCRAIRDAYDWKKDTRTFPWEQYLKTSLAYVEKTK